jgi:hypothetical protein
MRERKKATGIAELLKTATDLLGCAAFPRLLHDVI